MPYSLNYKSALREANSHAHHTETLKSRLRLTTLLLEFA
jgi:hypothetical protein